MDAKEKNNQQYEVIFGRVGRHPEMRRTQDGGFICDFSLAINQGKDLPAIWKRVVVWGELAQRCKERLSKGNEVFIRGRESVKKFQTKEGETREYTEVVAHLVGFNCV